MMLKGHNTSIPNIPYFIIKKNDYELNPYKILTKTHKKQYCFDLKKKNHPKQHYFDVFFAHINALLSIARHILIYTSIINYLVPHNKYCLCKQKIMSKHSNGYV